MDEAIVSPEHVAPPVILALDIGTSSVRALLFDRLGHAVRGLVARRSVELHTTVEGAAVVDPDVLLKRVWSCIDELLDRADAVKETIAGVAVCTFVSNVVGVNQRGRAVTPLITYADTRSRDAVDKLRRQLDEEAVHQRTGCLFHTSYLPAQFRWLADARPQLFSRVVRWLSLGEYMESMLFPMDSSPSDRGIVVSYSVASWTGLLDRRKLAWDAPLLAALPVSEGQLSPLTDVDAPRRGLRDRFAERWPALRDVPWFPPVGDGAAANLGSGCVGPDRIALTMGTTSAVRLVTDSEVKRVPDGLWCYRVDGQRSLPGGALSEGGSTFAWMEKTLQLPQRPELEAALKNMEPDDHGLTVLPFLAGERSPGWAGEAAGTIHGLSLATPPLAIVRAGMESVAYRLALILDRLGPLLPPDFQVVASGGALSSSQVWLRIVADVLGRPVLISHVEEASARGSALLGLEALGDLGNVADAPAFFGESVVPDDRGYARYQEAIRRQQMLYETLVS